MTLRVFSPVHILITIYGLANYWIHRHGQLKALEKYGYYDSSAILWHLVQLQCTELLHQWQNTSYLAAAANALPAV